jgi:hypothetical protein
MNALRRFLKTFKLKRPVIAVAVEWWFHLNNDPVHTAAVVTSSMAAMQFRGRRLDRSTARYIYKAKTGELLVLLI